MARYLLDVNILTELEDQEKPGFQQIKKKLSALTNEDDVLLSILTAYEYRYGISKAPAELTKRLENSWLDFESRFTCVFLSFEAAKIFGHLKSRYEVHTGASGRSLGRHAVDFMLASSALEFGLIIVSDDQIFQSIRAVEPSLQVENWKST